MEFADAKSFAVWLATHLSDAGLATANPLVDVQTRDASVEVFDGGGKQFIVQVIDTRPE